MTITEEPAIQCFISYAHADDVILEFIEPFKKAIKHFAFADRGRIIEFFVDRESIGWGDDWQVSIQKSINTATIFMPVITRQYFDRPSCREELLTFYSEAKTLGAGTLLLPVVIMGHSYMSTDSQDIAAKIIAERQYRDLQEAWIEGPQSATWRRTMMELANQLVDAADAAENSLATTTLETYNTSQPLGSQGDEDDDAPGYAEVGEALDRFETEVQDLMGQLGITMSNFTDIVNSYQDLAGKPKDKIRQAILEVAAKIKPHGLEFQKSARDFESLIVNTDVLMRRHVEYLKRNEFEDRIDELQEDLRSASEALDDVRNAEKVVTNFLSQIRPLEAASAPLRKSLRGFRVGATAINSGLSIMQSWPQLAG